MIFRLLFQADSDWWKVNIKPAASSVDEESEQDDEDADETNEHDSLGDLHNELAGASSSRGHHATIKPEDVASSPKNTADDENSVNPSPGKKRTRTTVAKVSF